MFGRITFENSRKRLNNEQDEGYILIYIYTLISESRSVGDTMLIVK